MIVNNMLRSASGAAILIGLAGVAPAWAQRTDTVDQTAQPAAEQPADSEDRVVITGSFIQGTPEDAALPVEVFSIEELEDRGAPTALEFAKSLTIAGPTTGEAYYFGGPALIGSVNYNIRGIGADKTLTLLNGRRMSSNTSNIPFAALSRVEILKDGAAVIYGADATGGVVNFITRDDFEGLEVNAQYKYVDSSDGDYGLSVLGGFGDDNLSFLWSAEWEHRSRLRAMDRDFTLDSLDPTAGLGNYNPAPWSTLTNLAGWLPLGPRPATPTIGANGAEFGAPVAGITSDFTPASCAAVGGRYDNAFTCAYNYSNYYNLVEDNDIYRAFAQLNGTFDDNTHFHVEAAYGQVKTPHMYASPSQPAIRGPAMAGGATFQFYVPSTNPHAAAFGARTGTSAASGYTPVTYRVLGHGGNAAFGGQGVPDMVDNQLWRVSASLDGKAGRLGGYCKRGRLRLRRHLQPGDQPQHAPRHHRLPLPAGAERLRRTELQRAGPRSQHASAPRTPRWPASARASGGTRSRLHSRTSPCAALPTRNTWRGRRTRLTLTRWLFDPREIETVSSNLTFDLVFNGSSPAFSCRAERSAGRLARRAVNSRAARQSTASS
jgi:iron complex outermembrane receptor protein